MTTSDSLHAIFNALEYACVTSQAWLAFEPVFRDIINHVDNNQWRHRFVAVCMGDAPRWERRALHAFEGSRFERRFWGNLEDQTMQLAAIWQLFEQYWDFSAMSKDGTSGLSFLQLMSRAIANTPGDMPGVHALIVAVSVFSQAADAGCLVSQLHPF